ncbi:MAG: CapA family protein [Prevotella sp.]|nr:CapA family protein [Prevotella sp.]
MSKILIVGDLFPVVTNEQYFSDADVERLFGEKICSMFKEADLRICNLEGALTDGKDRCDKTGPVISSPRSVVNTYKAMGIECCMLANNHITDAGHQGVLDTMQTLDDAGIKHIGAGENESSIKRFIVFDVCGKKIGFYNVCETMYNKPTKTKAGAWLYDEYVVCREINDYRKQCDFLIVIYHGGVEKFRYPSPETRKRFYRMVDSGANMILSQHTHCVGSEEYYKGSYLLYGQGNFLFRDFHDGNTDTGLMLEVIFDNDNFQVKKHMVHSVENHFVRYCDNQDFTAFDERSAKVKDEDFVMEEFEKFCYKELRLYLAAYKSPSNFQRVLRRYFPKQFKKYLYTKAFKRRDLMFALHSLRSEQNRETAICGIENLLNLK